MNAKKFSRLASLAKVLEGKLGEKLEPTPIAVRILLFFLAGIIFILYICVALFLSGFVIFAIINSVPVLTDIFGGLIFFLLWIVSALGFAIAGFIFRKKQKNPNLDVDRSEGFFSRIQFGTELVHLPDTMIGLLESAISPELPQPQMSFIPSGAILALLATRNQVPNNILPLLVKELIGEFDKLDFEKGVKLLVKNGLMEERSQISSSGKMDTMFKLTENGKSLCHRFQFKPENSGGT